MRTEITYLVGERGRWVWQFTDAAGAAVDFTGATLSAAIETGTACLTIAAAAGPDAQLGLSDGQCALALTPETITAPPRLWAYPISLWVTWPSGDRHCLDRGALHVREVCHG